MSFDEVFDLTAGLYFNFYNNTTCYKKGGNVERNRLRQLVKLLNPFRSPEPLSILNPSKFVPKNGFPAVKGLSYYCVVRRLLYLYVRSRAQPDTYS